MESVRLSDWTRELARCLAVARAGAASLACRHARRTPLEELIAAGE